MSLATPVVAESDELKDGLDKLGEGSRLLLKGLLGQIGPMMDDVNKALGELNAYHPPEILPNGDIIIRRKTPLEVVPQGEVDL